MGSLVQTQTLAVHKSEIEPEGISLHRKTWRKGNTVNSKSTDLHGCQKRGWNLGSWLRDPEHMCPWRHQIYQHRYKEDSPALWEFFPQLPKIITTPSSPATHVSVQAVKRSMDSLTQSQLTKTKKGQPSLLHVIPPFYSHLTFLIAPWPSNYPSKYK